MTTYTSLLGFALPVTGQLSGTWGDTVNDYITQYVDAAVAGAVTVNADTTLTKTTGSALGSTSSQYAIIIASGHSTNITVTAPAASKVYLVLNKSGSYTVKIRGAGPTTGITIAANKAALVAWDGSDFALVATTDVAALIGTLGVPSGGTGATTLTLNNVILGNGTSAVQFVAPGTNGNVLTSNGTTWQSTAPTSSLTGVTQSATPFETSLGYQAGNVATGINNTFIGYQSGDVVSTGNNNTAVGYSSLSACTIGIYNTAIGSQAMETAGTATTGCTAIGFNAILSVSGNYNTAVGSSAATNLGSGANNTFIGAQINASSSSVDREIVVGYALTGKGTQTAYIGGTSGAYNAKNVTTWETTSDERIKRNIVDSPKGLAEVKQLRVRNFNYKQVEDMPLNEEGKPIIDNLDPNRLITGFIAQELQTVMPECVQTTASGLLSVSSDAIIYALVKAVQELAAEVEALKAR